MIALYILFLFLNLSHAILYPKITESREVIKLDGLWNFAVDKYNISLIQQWFKAKLDLISDELMPVPSSYNDIAVDSDIRNHVGLVWYQKEFIIPHNWRKKSIWIRFSSVSYAAEVWINKNFVGKHEIGHLPFEFEITSFVKFDVENIVTVSCNNILTEITVPQGTLLNVTTDNGYKIIQTYTFDFFNYAGIHRSVILYSKPFSYIDDITTETVYVNSTEGFESAQMKYNVTLHLNETNSNFNVKVTMFDPNNRKISLKNGTQGVFKINKALLWWPYLMNPKPGMLYTVKVTLQNGTNLIDTYSLKIGLRKLTWSNDTFKINDVPIYLHGFGKHEDADIRGKGLDLPTIIRDFNLIKWVGANSFRTSHYPYADEIMDLADRYGIMVIDECPAVNIANFTIEELLKNHKTSITEMIDRDKNHPSVIAWSIANEPRSNIKEAKNYFRQIKLHTKNLDKTRPITASINKPFDKDQLAQHLDIISFNKYNAWYQNAGNLDTIIKNLLNDTINWRTKFNKPIILSEYGADTIAGLHEIPVSAWTEDYQVQLFSKHFKAFDQLRSKGWFVGEFVWNFADFKTDQSIRRVDGNKKGIFTRNRQPKAAAFHLRRRYFKLSNLLYGAPLPRNLDDYTISTIKLEL